MIEAFFLTTLPALWRRLCALSESSRCYALLQSLYRRLCKAARESFLGALLTRQDTQKSRTDGALTRTLHRLGTRLHLAEALDGRSLKRLDFSVLAGALLLAMFLCPAQQWNNRLALLLALLLAAVLLVLTMARRRRLLSVRELGWGFVLFMAASLCGLASAHDLGEAVRVFAFYVTSFLLALTLAAGLSDRAKLRRFLGFLYLAVVCTAVFALWQRLTGVAVNSSQTDLAANAGMPGRVYSSFENPNNYAEFLVLFLPLSFTFTTTLKNKRARLGATALLLLPLAALAMTYSRSGWVSFVLAAAVLLFFCRKRTLPLLAFLALLALPLLPQTVFRRILTIGSTSDSSNLYRVYIWRGTLGLLRRFGLTGVGFGPENFHPVYVLFCNGHAREAQHAHMLWLELWAEMGIAGLISYVTFHFGLLRRAILAHKTASGSLRMTLAACAAALTGICFSATVEHIWFYPRDMFAFFVLVGVTLAAVRIADTEQQKV